MSAPSFHVPTAKARIVKDTKWAGLDALAKRLESEAQQVLIGVPGAAQEKDGTSLAKIAAVHEFGGFIKPFERVLRHSERTGRFVKKTAKSALLSRGHWSAGITIPERSYLRAGIRAYAQDFVRLNKISLRRILAGNMDVPTALGKLGAYAAGAIKKYIRQGYDFVPLRPSTMRRKGSTKPLVDTGQLIQSITWLLGGKPTQEKSE